MVFSSPLFLFCFLPAALVLYYGVPRRVKHLLLTVCSYVFYGWSNPLFIVLLLTSTLIDYCAGLAMVRGCSGTERDALRLDPTAPRTRGQRIALLASICSNLTLLGVFKYFNFGIENYNALVHSLGLNAWHLDTALRITLPLGISFYTFQSLSYTIDVYRGHTFATRNFIDFACFVSMFPQLVAGPIVRYSEVAEQLKERSHTTAKFARGVAFLSVGLAKKVLLANPCGKVADLAFDARGLGALDAWYGVVAYAFQIYFDFSGYSDMAIGLGLMLGFVFPKNFDSPYRSASITEFWHRWHISLSTFLRDYLYVPLGGSRRGRVRTYVNLLIVMLLGGLWHGAAWNYVVWGGLHGALLAFERVWPERRPYRHLPQPLRIALTFVVVLVGWVFFRAADLEAAIRYLGYMSVLGSRTDAAALVGGVVYQPYYLLTITAAAFVTWACPQTWEWTRTLTARKAIAVVVLFGAAALVLMTQTYNPFIYFIF